MMFSLGNKVKLSNGLVGEIILWHFDEGDLWYVEVGKEVYECYNEEMELVK